ncbi:hypothetical protein BJV74DRAFT_796166 [Russula compacta]|nr:hypothetical protein BJV74DRAFT_796166 [Russula compacta]
MTACTIRHFPQQLGSFTPVLWMPSTVFPLVTGICFSSPELRSWVLGGMERVAKAASEGPSEIDDLVMEWTIDALSEDDGLEKFFQAIPGFYKLDIIGDFRWHLNRVQSKIKATLLKFLDHALSLNSVSGAVKSRQLAIYLNAASDVDSSAVCLMFENIILWKWRGDKASDRAFPFYVQGIIALILANVREIDDHWMALALNQFKVPMDVLQYYLDAGESVLLMNLIHFIRAFTAPSEFYDPQFDFTPILRDPSSYLLCNIPGHHLHSTSNAAKVAAGEAAHLPAPAFITVSPLYPVQATTTPSSLQTIPLRTQAMGHH